MKISIEYCGSAPWQYRFSAIDDDIFDGAPDSATRNLVGYGATQEEAVRDLIDLLADWAEERAIREEATS